MHIRSNIFKTLHPLADRVLTKTPKSFRYLSRQQLSPDDIALHERLIPCRLIVEDSGLFTYTYTDQPTNICIYERDIPDNLESMLSEALAELYTGYKTPL